MNIFLLSSHKFPIKNHSNSNFRYQKIIIKIEQKSFLDSPIFFGEKDSYSNLLVEMTGYIDIDIKKIYKNNNIMQKEFCKNAFINVEYVDKNFLYNYKFKTNAMRGTNSQPTNIKYPSNHDVFQKFVTFEVHFMEKPIVNDMYNIFPFTLVVYDDKIENNIQKIRFELLESEFYRNDIRIRATIK